MALNRLVLLAVVVLLVVAVLAPGVAGQGRPGGS